MPYSDADALTDLSTGVAETLLHETRATSSPLWGFDYLRHWITCQSRNRRRI